MDEVRLELGHRPLDRGIGQADRELLVARGPETAGPDHGHVAVAALSGARGNDQQFVPAGPQPIGDVASRVRHAVDLRQEGLSHHHDAHTPEVPQRA